MTAQCLQDIVVVCFELRKPHYTSSFAGIWFKFSGLKFLELVQFIQVKTDLHLESDRG